jgi:ureidoglycolate lyase
MKPVDITSIDFDTFGILYDMTIPSTGKAAVNRSFGDGWEDSHTDNPIIDTFANLGYTTSKSTPFSAHEMERHMHTQEALFCDGEPIIFLIAPPSDEDAPNRDNVIAVLLNPGMVAVLNRGVWHSAAHGLKWNTGYYYLAHCYRDEPTEWRPITGGPIYVKRP